MYVCLPKQDDVQLDFVSLGIKLRFVYLPYEIKIIQKLNQMDFIENNHFILTQKAVILQFEDIKFV